MLFKFKLWIYLTIFVTLTARLTNANLIIKTNNQIIVNLDSVEIIFKLSNNTKLTEEITFEATDRLENVSGKIFVSSQSTKADALILQAQQQGAVAVIKTTTLTEAGFQRYQYSDKDAVRQINIHVFEVAYNEGKILMAMVDSDQIQTITVVPDEGDNPWEIVFTSPGYYIWSAVLFAFSATNIGLAVWKFQAFIKYYGGFIASVAIFILIIEAVSNVLRIVSLVDPFGAYGIYDEYASVSLLNVSFPFGISSYMLLVLYWHEMMTSSSVVVHKFISSMRIPFYVITAVLLAQNLVMKITVRFVPIPNYFLIITIVYLVLIVALTGLYMSIGIRILKRLHGSKKMGRRVQRLRATTIKLLTSVMFFFILVCIGILFVVKVAYSAVGLFVCWFALFTVLNGASMMNILAFKVPMGSSGTSNQSRSRSVSTPGPSRPSSITKEEKKAFEKQFKEAEQPQMEQDSESEDSDTFAESDVEDNDTPLEAANNSEDNV